MKLLRALRGDDMIDAFRDSLAAQQGELYGRGFMDGTETALRLLLGETGQRVYDGNPCPQPLTVAAERWARDALARLTEGAL